MAELPAGIYIDEPVPPEVMAARRKLWAETFKPRPRADRIAFLKSQASDPILAMASEPAQSTVPNLGSATHEGLRSSHRRRPRR